MSANLAAIQKVVSDLRESGGIPSWGSALVQICVSLAAAVDAEPGNASLWREYRQAEAALRNLDQVSEGEIDRLISALRDTEDGPAHARAEARGSG